MDRAKQVAWMVIQALAIGGLTWAAAADMPDTPFGHIVFLSVIIVAFLGAVIINLWDWLLRLLHFRRRANPARPEPNPGTPHIAQAKGEDGRLRMRGDCQPLQKTP